MAPTQPTLSRPERLIYAALCDAAERGLVCPNYLDLNEVAGYESASASPNVVNRLQRKGLIVVDRYHQRGRRVQIVATGKWTAYAPGLALDRPHKPRGGVYRYSSPPCPRAMPLPS